MFSRKPQLTSLAIAAVALIGATAVATAPFASALSPASSTSTAFNPPAKNGAAPAASPISTATTVSGSPNPATFTSPAFTSASVMLTAKVVVTDGSGLTVSDGTVTFVDGAASLGSAAVTNGQATLTVALGEGTHQIVASYADSGTVFASSSGSFDQRVNTATSNPSSGSGAGPYTYCNTSPITAPTPGFVSGAASPYPSNIFVTNLPGTVNQVSVSLTGFSTNDQGDLLALLVGPGGNNLDFFSLTGSNVSIAPSPINVTFSDTAASLVAAGSPGNLVSAGTFKPTSYNNNVTYPQCPPNATICASPPVGPPLSSNPFTPSQKAAVAGTSILGNANAAGAFGGTVSSTYNGNGTWSLYLDDGGPTGQNGQAKLTGGWCLNVTTNLPTVTASKSHGGTFAQGEPNVPFTINITNNGPGSTGDPTGGRNPLIVTDSLNSVFSYAGFAGTGWNCSAVVTSGVQVVTCTNDSAVAQGANYAPLMIDVSTSPTAAAGSIVPNNVSLSGGGARSTSSNTDMATISAAPALTLQKSHTGNFTAGQTAQWNLTVSNAVASSTTYGTVTMLDTLPAGYTLASYSSTASAWTCSGSTTVTCLTTAGISGGANSAINLTVNVPTNSPAFVTNSAAVFGGGDLTHTSLATAARSNSDTATVSTAPAIAISPLSLSFGNQTVGVKSAPMPITVTNNGGAALTFDSITMTGANTTSLQQTNDCPASLAEGLQCTISVTFDPTGTGPRSASVTLTDNVGTQSVPATGNGVAAPISLSPTSLAFGDETVGVPAVKPVTVKNNGSSALSIASITITGTNTVSFQQTNNCGASLAGQASCTVNVSFKPTGTGPRSAAVTLVDGVGTQNVPLSGSGVAAPITLTPASIEFGNETVDVPVVKPVTVKNNTTSAIMVTSISMTGANTVSFQQSNNCGSSIPASGSCTINVTFKPTGTGARSASVTLVDGVGTQNVPLAGTGVAAPITITPTSLAFGDQTVSVPASMPITVTNNGTSAISLTSITVTGANTVSFQQTNNCGANIPAPGSCSVTVTFKPTGTGARSASVTLVDNLGTQNVPLTGTGIAP